MSLFTSLGCGSCHVLQDAGSQGEVGPNLDNVLADVDEEFVRESIVSPDAEIAEGFQPGVMPGTYGEQLSEQQLDALVEYLLEAAGGGE
jgi:mono/diheme cytochrome c family protein